MLILLQIRQHIYTDTDVPVILTNQYIVLTLVQSNFNILKIKSTAVRLSKFSFQTIIIWNWNRDAPSVWAGFVFKWFGIFLLGLF